MKTVTLEDAQLRLPEIIAQLQPHESVIILQNEEAIGYLSPPPSPRREAQVGSCPSLLTFATDDEERHDEFADR